MAKHKNLLLKTSLNLENLYNKIMLSTKNEVINKLYLISSIILMAIYLLLTYFILNLIINKKVVEGLLFWIMTFILNISIALVFIKIKIEKYIILKSITISIISNFMIIGFSSFLVLKPFRTSMNVDPNDIFIKLLHCFFEILIVGNWLLPIIITIAKKARIYKNDGTQ